MRSTAAASSPSLGRHDLRLVAHGQGFEASARGTLHVRGGVVPAQRLQRAAQHAHDPIGALGIAAEPEQVVGDTALDDALRALHAGGFDGRLPQAAMRGHLAVSDDPNIARACFWSAEGDGKVGYDGHGEATGHDREAIGRGGDEQANGEGLRHQALRGEGRRRAKADALLGDEHLAVQANFLLQRAPLRFGEAGSELAVLGSARPPSAFLGRVDDHAVEVGDDMRAVGGVAKPPA